MCLPAAYCLLLTCISFSQQRITGDTLKFDYAKPTEYEIGGVTVTGAGTLDQSVLQSISGLIVGDKIKIPGDAIATAIKNLWKEGFFEDVKVLATKIEGKNIFLEIQVKERPRLSKFSFTGVKKHEADDLRDKLKLNRGKVVTDNLMVNSKNEVLDHFIKKGYLNTKVTVTQKKDSTLVNSIILFIAIDKGSKVRIRKIDFHGNTALKDKKLRRAMKDTKQKKWYSIFTSAEFIESDFEKDKEKVVEKYQSYGYRDAKIVKDSIYKIGLDHLGIDIYVNEGRKYYFRNITWVGNSKYASRDLDRALSIKKGDVYNQSVLESRLFMNPNGTDISSLYMDDGYLFFQATPVEVMVEHDSIDLEIRMYEGKQATINKVLVKGNTKTNDHVIMREIRTRPGQLFKRSDIIRSQREISMLGYFNAEKLGVTPTPHPENGTVDIEYQVEEKSSDQLELSGGFGAGRVIGTLGVSFNNFSARNTFKKGAWQPLPSGDGQRLSIRAQASGLLYQSINMSFAEPWLGGKKPNSLTITPYYNVMSNGLPKSDPGRGYMHIFGTSVGFGKRKKFPDDFFMAQWEASYQYYELNGYSGYNTVLAFDKGFANNINLKYTLSRNSVDDMTYPRSGSNVTFSAQLTPPFSLFDKLEGKNINYAALEPQQKYKWLEYYKLKFTSAWYTRLAGKLVLYTKLGYGWLGSYNQAKGLSPFERFYLGGSGLTGFNPFDGREIIALRGYDDGSVYGNYDPLHLSNSGASSILKYTMELRYPISLNPSATIYGLAFTDAGNSWGTIKDFNPFDVKRSAGVGLRFFLPMFGLLGFDYAWRFDDIPYKPGMQKSQFHFTIGYNLGEL